MGGRGSKASTRASGKKFGPSTLGGAVDTHVSQYPGVRSQFRKDPAQAVHDTMVSRSLADTPEVRAQVHGRLSELSR